MGGSAPFQVESEIPSTNRFLELKVSNLSVKLAAVQVGSFALSSTGVLTFTAGVSFTTLAGANYRLRYITALNSRSVRIEGEY